MVQEFEQEEWNAAWWFFFFWCKYEILESYLIFRYKIRDSIVEPQFNEPLYNEVLSITNDFIQPKLQ